MTAEPPRQTIPYTALALVFEICTVTMLPMLFSALLNSIDASAIHGNTALATLFFDNVKPMAMIAMTAPVLIYIICWLTKNQVPEPYKLITLPVIITTSLCITATVILVLPWEIAAVTALLLNSYWLAETITYTITMKKTLERQTKNTGLKP